jgi:hypothetical protein
MNSRETTTNFFWGRKSCYSKTKPRYCRVCGSAKEEKKGRVEL